MSTLLTISNEFSCAIGPSTFPLCSEPRRQPDSLVSHVLRHPHPAFRRGFAESKSRPCDSCAKDADLTGDCSRDRSDRRREKASEISGGRRCQFLSGYAFYVRQDLGGVSNQPWF